MKESKTPVKKGPASPPPSPRPTSSERAAEALRIQQSQYNNSKNGIKSSKHKVSH